MAFIDNTAFEARVTNGRFNDLENVAGKYGALDMGGDFVFADCSAGILCTRLNPLPVEGFSGLDNENAWAMINAETGALASDPIYACNTYDWQLLNGYAVGHKTLGLGVPAGKYGNFTRIYFDGEHRYRFGVANFDTTPAVGDVFTIDAGLLAKKADVPADNGAVYFKVISTGNFVEGTKDSFGYAVIA